MIKKRDALLSYYQTLGIGKVYSSEAKLQLKVAQGAVDDAIALAKLAWSAHQAEKMHSMRFNLRGVWESVSLISGGYTSHHASSTVMWMLLTNGELETNDAENASVFGPHFHRIFNNHIPID